MMLNQYRQWFMEILMVGGSEKTKPIKAKFTYPQRGRRRLIFSFDLRGRVVRFNDKRRRLRKASFINVKPVFSNPSRQERR